MKTRNEIADELLLGCPECECDSYADDPDNNPDQCQRCDHDDVATAIRDSVPWDQISNMPQLNNWPDSYSWVLAELEDAQSLS
jgi:hypothetical protein